MDSTNRSVIVEDKITWPNGLTLDFINDRIYWADAREDYIEFASLDGTNRHTGNRPVHKQIQIPSFTHFSNWFMTVGLKLHILVCRNIISVYVMSIFSHCVLLIITLR